MKYLIIFLFLFTSCAKAQEDTKLPAAIEDEFLDPTPSATPASKVEAKKKEKKEKKKLSKKTKKKSKKA